MSNFRTSRLLACAALLGSCTDPALAELERMVPEIENLVTLPEGAGPLACYDRHYVLLEGTDEIEAALGVPWHHSDRLVQASYVPIANRQGSEGSVILHSGFDEMPQIYDAGCSDIGFIFVPGDFETPIAATCSLDVAGDIPERIEPPVTC